MFWDKFVNKLSEKAFHSEEFQKSWKVHMDAFAPILEPAFAQDPGNRLNLVAALNVISRGDLKNGKKKLLAIKKACKTDADKAAWAYFMGLLYERSGDRRQMISHYSVSCGYNHRFYLPYLKLAKCAHEESLFEVAEENYRKGISCLDDMPEGQREQHDMVLGSIYANLASCLVMMHRPEEAREMLENARDLRTEAAELLATEAILCASKKLEAEAQNAISQLEACNPKLTAAVRPIVNSILDGSNSHFHAQPVPQDQIMDFWQKFSTLEADFRNMCARDDDYIALRQIQEMVAPMFSFLKIEPVLSLKAGSGGKQQLELSTFFNRSLESGYAVLLDACPAEIKANWEFIIVH